MRLYRFSLNKNELCGVKETGMDCTREWTVTRLFHPLGLISKKNESGIFHR